MSDDRIDIEITDKVSPTIRTKILDIAEASRQADSAVERLKVQLTKINDTALSRLSNTTKSLTNEMVKQIAATTRVELTMQKKIIGDLKAATAQQKLATEIARTESAAAASVAGLARATTATLGQEAASSRLVIAKLKEQRAVEAAASAAAKAANSAAKPTVDRAADIEAYGASLDKLRTKFNPLYAVITQYKQTLADIRAAHAVGAISTDEMTAAINRERATALQTISAIKARDNAIKGGTQSTKLQAYQLQNLGFQINDVVVGLASGQKPLTVLIQQGSQIAGVFGPGVGLTGIIKGLAESIKDTVKTFLPLIIIVGTISAAVKLLQVEINKGVDPKELTAGLKLTDRQLRKLKDDIQVTFGDTFLAVFQVAGKAILDTLGTDVNQLSTNFTNVYNTILDNTKFFINGIVGLYRSLTGVLGDVFAIVFSRSVDEFKGSFETLKSDFKNFLPELEKNISVDTVGKAVDAIKGQAISNAKERIYNTAKDKGFFDPKKGREDHTAEKRADALAKVNRELDSELARMKLLQPERALEQQFDQIKNDLANKHITLTDQETASIRKKIAAVQAYHFVQDQLDRIREAAVAPSRDYNATLEAANRLYSIGVINARQYYNEIATAKLRVLDQQETIAAGVESGFLRIQTSVKTVSQTVSDTMVGAFDGLSDSITNAVTTGKFGFADLAQSVVASLVKMTAQLLIIQPLFNVFQGLTGLGSPVGAVAAPIPTTSVAALPGHAEGGSFEIGGRAGVDKNLVAFRGTAGEKVNITPLNKRTSDNSGNVVVNVINNNNSKIETKENVTNNGKSIDVVVDELVAKSVSNFGSKGSKALRDTYGLTPSLNGAR